MRTLQKVFWMKKNTPLQRKANKINGQYCASNEGLLTDILRGEWGFQGFVVTDWGDYDVLAHEGHALAAMT